MKDILIIVAHPKVESLSFGIAQRYQTLAEAAGCRTTLLDLYRDSHRQPFFTYEGDPFEREPTPEMDYYQGLISKADTLVFVFPYWWGSMPGILKNFIDWNFSMGFAATFVNGRPVGLLTDKRVMVYTTTGTPWWYYTLTGANGRFRRMFKKQIVNFCGMTLEGCHMFGGIDTKGTNPDKILDRITL